MGEGQRRGATTGRGSGRFHRIQIDSVTHTALDRMCTWDVLPGTKTAGAWSWCIKSILNTLLILFQCIIINLQSALWNEQTWHLNFRGVLETWNATSSLSWLHSYNLMQREVCSLSQHTPYFINIHQLYEGHLFIFIVPKRSFSIRVFCSI